MAPRVCFIHASLFCYDPYYRTDKRHPHTKFLRICERRKRDNEHDLIMKTFSSFETYLAFRGQFYVKLFLLCECSFLLSKYLLSRLHNTCWFFVNINLPRRYSGIIRREVTAPVGKTNEAQLPFTLSAQLITNIIFGKISTWTKRKINWNWFEFELVPFIM